MTEEKFKLDKWDFIVLGTIYLFEDGISELFSRHYETLVLIKFEIVAERQLKT